MFWLGEFYSRDRPPDSKDDSLAFTYYRRAAENGHPLAEWYVADAYETSKGVLPSEAEAIRWLRLAAADEVTGAQLRRGLRYQSGEGVPQDSAMADELLRLAVTPHDDRAKYGPHTRWTAKARNALAQGNIEVVARVCKRCEVWRRPN